MLKLSRELIDAFLNKSDITLGVEHYFMFTITKFLLTKEQTIKKDTNGKTLEFDINNKYLTTILTQYHELQKRMYYTVDGIHTLDEVEDSVRLTSLNDEIKNDKSFVRMIKEAVWTIDKLRDSFAHGKYDFDIKNHLIIINNEYDTFDEQGHIVHHVFRCEVPPELLSLLGKSYKDTFNKCKDETLSNQFERRYSSTYRMLQNKYNLLLRDRDYRRFVKPSNKKTLSYMNEELYVHNKAIIKVAETMRTLGLNGEENDILTSLLYNHLLLLLSDETKEYNYEDLLLLNLDYSFASIKDEKNKGDDITNTIGPIKRSIKSFSKQYKKINDYEKTKRYRNIFKLLYESLKEQFGIRNKSVIKRIRNSIMHGNIEIDSTTGIIRLFDRNDNTNDSSINQFECITDNYGLVALIDELENRNKYTFQMFIIEIDKLLTSFGLDYNYIYEKINEIFLCLKAIDNNINLNTSMDDVMNKILLADLKDKREQLVNVLRNIKDKKEEEVETEDKGITL